ncbi:MAG: phosphoribosyl-AMP cyclohydrolase [Candidatus Bathyarchaeia archaeon]
MTRKKISIEKLGFAKEKGLIPVVVQDANSKEVLMLAYTNMEALKKTLETGYAHYWSRSRQKLWMKGETSGNVQKIKNIIVDCDYDALLFIVEQKGNACHTGERTCFHNELCKE